MKPHARFARLSPLSLLLAAFASFAATSGGEDAVSTTDHYVPVVSEAPAMAGETAQIYVRERAPEGLAGAGDLEGDVVLFVHGAGTPAEVAFDPPSPGHSWMAYLARAGFDAFSMDTTGYGRSTRPYPMNDRCNLSAEQQEDLFGGSCAPSYPSAATSLASDWHDIDAVVDYLRELRDVDRVHLVGWSLGGPRAAGYAARHPEKVGNIVLLAPAYLPNIPAEASGADPAGAAMTKQSKADFDANWERQVGCADQYDPAVGEAVWGAMLDSDPVGATWGDGVRRAPRTVLYGWTPAVVAQTRTPILMVAGRQDRQVRPELVRNFYNDLGAERKVYLEMECASHNAMWERDAQELFAASAQWLRDASYQGESQGMFGLPEED